MVKASKKDTLHITHNHNGRILRKLLNAKEKIGREQNVEKLFSKSVN